MDLIVRNVRLADRPNREPVDIGVEGGRIAAIGPGIGGQIGGQGRREL